MEKSPQPIEVGPSTEAVREIQAAIHEGILTAVATRRLKNGGIENPTPAEIIDRIKQIIQETTEQDAANVK